MLRGCCGQRCFLCSGLPELDVADAPARPGAARTGSTVGAPHAEMAIPFPPAALAYGEAFYWDKRYNDERAKHGKDHCFEWYCDLDDLWPILETYGGEDFALVRFVFVVAALFYCYFAYGGV